MFELEFFFWACTYAILVVKKCRLGLVKPMRCIYSQPTTCTTSFLPFFSTLELGLNPLLNVFFCMLMSTWVSHLVCLKQLIRVREVGQGRNNFFNSPSHWMSELKHKASHWIYAPCLWTLLIFIHHPWLRDVIQTPRHAKIFLLWSSKIKNNTNIWSVSLLWRRMQKFYLINRKKANHFFAIMRCIFYGSNWILLSRVNKWRICLNTLTVLTRIIILFFSIVFANMKSELMTVLKCRYSTR